MQTSKIYIFLVELNHYMKVYGLNFLIDSLHSWGNTQFPIPQDSHSTPNVLGNRFIGTVIGAESVPIKRLPDVTGWPLCWAAQVTWRVGHLSSSTVSSSSSIWDLGAAGDLGAAANRLRAGIHFQVRILFVSGRCVILHPAFAVGSVWVELCRE